MKKRSDGVDWHGPPGFSGDKSLLASDAGSLLSRGHWVFWVA